MLALNKTVFLLLNAPAHPFQTTVAVAEFAASDVIVFVPCLFVGLWIWGDSMRRAGLIATAIAAALALGANQVIGLFWYEPRPFMLGIGRTLMTHAPENSFPSDHTTFMLSVGAGLLATAAAPAWGRIVIALGLLVAWARIYLGLHFPVDMLASGVIGGFFGGAAPFLLSPVRRWVMPWAQPAYQTVLRILRLPIRGFPRSPGT
jgi:undecaprenyl-diphosphatase